MKKLLLILTIFLVTTTLVEAKYIVNTAVKGVSISATTTPDLVGWWTFDGQDMIGGKLNDRSTYNNDGNLISIATSTFYTMGKFGQAGKFDGVNDYVRISDSASLQPVNFTISAWFNCPSFDTVQTIIAKNYTTAPWSSPFASVLLRINSSVQIEFGRTPTHLTYQSSNGAVSLNTNQWYHVAITYIGAPGTRSMYLNSSQLFNTTGSSEIVYTSQPWTIGADHSASPSGDNAKCKIDDVRIYNRTFSTTEISHLYKTGFHTSNTTSTTTPIGTLGGYWSFDGKTMLTGAAKDLTSNNNTGVLSGIATTSLYIKGKIGQALQFDGTNDAMTIPVSLSGLSKATVAFWMKWDRFANDDDLAMEYTNNFNSKNGFIIDPNQAGGKFRVGISSSAGTANTSDITRPSEGVWHHYVVVFDRTIVGANISETVYVDGGLQAITAGSQTYASATNFDAGSLYIMSRGAASLFGKGGMDDLRVYRGALTAADALQIYKSGNYRIREAL